MKSNKESFSWTKLFLFKTLTEKPTENSAGPIIFAFIIIGIFVLKLPWWLCVLLVIVTIMTKAKKSE
ncbi:MAG: hypothetical protein ACYCX2_02475 [Christensenellales bacterium]